MEDYPNLSIDYNAEPVFYCENCLSLAILTLDGIEDYCDDCGSLQVNSTQISNWDELYKNKYGKTLMEK